MMITRYRQKLATKGEESTERERDLEEQYGEKALAWVKQQNKKTFKRFMSADKQAAFHVDATDESDFAGRLSGNYVYFVRKNKAHPQGLWCRTTVEQYKKPKPMVEVLLDIDALPEREEWEELLHPELPLKKPNYSWFWSGSVRSATGRYMVGLSYGGGDKSVYREYDERKREFVKEGFTSTRAAMSWFDENTLLITGHDANHLTAKGAKSCVIRLWKRGEVRKKAQIIYNSGEYWAEPVTYHLPFGAKTYLIKRELGDSKKEYFIIDGNDFSLQRLNISADASVKGFVSNSVIFSITEDWQCGKGTTYKAGSLLSIDLDDMKASEHPEINVIFEPTASCVLRSTTIAGNHVLVTVLNNVRDELFQYDWQDGWEKFKIPLPANGVITVFDNEMGSDVCIIRHGNIITPETDYAYDMETKNLSLLKSFPSSLQAKHLVLNQYWAVSKDGTLVPYFAAHAKTLAYDGRNPAILKGYGGFGSSSLPDCEGDYEAEWFKRGGVILIANIRGGGEFGPRWYKAAIKEKRHCGFEDFIAIAEDAINRGITSPEHLGIQGYSNGGLLVGVAFTQRPDLFRAVVCGVPVLDMLNFSSRKLDGKNWIREYGDPADIAMRKVLEGYSPFHNVFPNKKYPEVLFLSSTEDDRVHPGHARKMVDKMTMQGHTVYYYEKQEGGHTYDRDLDNEERITFNYFWQKLSAPGLALVLKPVTEREKRLARRHSLFQPAEMAEQEVKHVDKRRKVAGR